MSNDLDVLVELSRRLAIIGDVHSLNEALVAIADRFNLARVALISTDCITGEFIELAALDHKDPPGILNHEARFELGYDGSKLLELAVASGETLSLSDHELLAALSVTVGMAWSSLQLKQRHDQVQAELRTVHQSHQRSRTFLKELSKRLTDRAEAERRRLSRELHDQAGQSLTAILIQLDLIIAQLENPALQQELQRIETLVEQTIDELRRLARDLRPAVLDDLGLDEAIRLLADGFSGGLLSVTIIADHPFPRFPGSIETALYRIAQEALNNVKKHSQATVAAVRLQHGSGKVHMEIKDNGVGFDQEIVTDLRESIGLLGMRERVEALSGTLTIDSTSGNGTRLRVEIPIN